MGIVDKFFGRDKKIPDVHAGRTGAPHTSGADRPVADFSDVSGSSSSTPVESDRSYTVAAGDSLSKIAQREYGDAAQWRRIYEANRATIANPDLIHPGQVLAIPTDR